MKTFKQLSETQKETAVQKCLESELRAILEDGVRFDDKLNYNDLQARIDAACSEADKMQTPWFAHEYILDTCREDLTALAQCQAEDALYSEGEYVISDVLQ